MAGEDGWPPKSPHQALLSSPSGRRRYEGSQTIASSPRKLPGTPSLLDRLRAARANQDHLPFQKSEEEEDEDEETLQLKLAAIEAKLKLKKLQQNKTRNEENVRPKSSGDAVSQPQSQSSKLQVPLSPSKRLAPPVEPRSPGRVLLGIDKGINAADVSLRRAKTVSGSPSKERRFENGNNPVRLSRESKHSNQHKSTASTSHIKSFSERMSENRQTDRNNEQKGDAIRKSRSTNFKINHTEVEQFRSASEKASSRTVPHEQGSSSLRLRSPERKLRANGGVEQFAIEDRAGSMQSTPILQGRRSPSKPTERGEHVEDPDKKQGDAAMFEGFSGLHLSSRILPHTFVKRTLPTDRFTIYRIPNLLKVVHSPAYEIPDEVADYVVFGVIASKSNPMDHKPKSAEEYSKQSNDWEKKWDDGSQNRKRFMVFTLTDLKWTIDLYLFDSAVPRYHRLSVGQVVAILNPNIMPPKRGRQDTGAFSLAINDGEDQILEIGTSKHFGYCTAKKRDGSECGQWVNAAKTEICEWHLNAEIAKTRSRRMGVNAGTNGFGPNWRAHGNEDKQKRIKEGRRFDFESGSHFFIASSNADRFRANNGGSRAPVYNPDRSTARLLDYDDQDPFIAEGQLARGKDERLQKRMAAQQKERDIAARLGQLGSGGGAEYMRHRIADSSGTPGSQRSILSSGTGNRKADVMNSGSSSQNTSEVGRKRAAESIRLSPVKKTRFLTDKGIKEAGRESLGTTTMTARGAKVDENHEENDDDDDDLDIV